MFVLHQLRNLYIDRYILEQNFEIPIGTIVKIDTLRFSIDLFREQNIILGIPRSKGS